MRGKLLSTFRLGLSQWAPDHNAIDYAAIRDKHAQLAQPQCFESWFLGKISLRKLDISFWTFFMMNNMLPFPLSPWEVRDLHPATFWGWMGLASPNIVWAWGDRVGENGMTCWEVSQNPSRGLHWDLADLTQALCSPCMLSQQVKKSSMILKLTRLGFPELFIVNQVSQSFGPSCGFPDAHSVLVKPIHQNCWNPDNYSSQVKQLWHLFAYSDTLSISLYDFWTLTHQDLPTSHKYTHSATSTGKPLQGWCCRMDPTSGPVGPTTLQATTSNLNFSLKINVDF